MIGAVAPGPDSSAGQSDSLLRSRPQVRILLGALTVGRDLRPDAHESSEGRTKRVHASWRMAVRARLMASSADSCGESSSSSRGAGGVGVRGLGLSQPRGRAPGGRRRSVTAGRPGGPAGPAPRPRTTQRDMWATGGLDDVAATPVVTTTAPKERGPLAPPVPSDRPLAAQVLGHNRARMPARLDRNHDSACGTVHSTHASAPLPPAACTAPSSTSTTSEQPSAYTAPSDASTPARFAAHPSPSTGSPKQAEQLRRQRRRSTGRTVRMRWSRAIGGTDEQNGQARAR